MPAELAPERLRPPRLAPPTGPRPPAPVRWATHLRTPGLVAARLLGDSVRRRHLDTLERGRLASIAPPCHTGHAVASFSSGRDVPEQAASIRSFLRFAGRPTAWTVVSDGSHSEAQRRILESLDPAVRVVDWREVVAGRAPAPAMEAAARHPLGKKLAVVASLPVDGRPVLLVDSDILFRTGAASVPADVVDAREPRFQLDCFNVLDPRLVPEDEQDAPTNTGVLVLPGPLRWDRGMALLERELARPGAFGADGAWVEQGVTHLALRDSGARPLDPARHVIGVADIALLGERDDGPDVALRHYAGPTRHKLWVRVRADGLAR